MTSWAATTPLLLRESRGALPWHVDTLLLNK